MKISVLYSPAPRDVHEWTLELPEGSKVAQALEGCELFGRFPDLELENPVLGVWGKRVAPGKVLHEGDRVEVYRNLRVDPKVARRERFSQQGVKRAGLFSATRVGGKAGY